MRKFHEAYVKYFNESPKTILEIGSRDGDSAEDLRALSNAKAEDVYVVEPHPESFRRIIQKYPGFHVFELAVSNEPGVVSFNAIPYTYSHGTVGTSSLLRKNMDFITKIVPNATSPERWVKVLAVSGRTILQLIDRPGIDAVKIDVEGFTYEVLKSFGDDVRLLKALHVEVEKIPIWENQKYYDDVKRLLAWYNFEETYYEGMFWVNYSTGEKGQGDSVWMRKD
jgi:FkbM family methyltransferase